MLFSTVISPKSSSCDVVTLLLLESSSNPVNAVTISLLEHCCFGNNLLNINVLLCNSALNIVFTLSATVYVSVIAIFSIFFAFLFSLFNTLFPTYWTERGLESHVYYPQLKAHMENYGTHMQSWGSFTEGRKDIFHEPLLMDIAEKYILQTSFLKRKSREIRFPSHLFCIFAI